jgi:hypothetical protein
MTRRQENTILEALEDIYSEVHENNIMLHQLCQVVNTYLSRHNVENEDDFGRNILANLISSGIDLGRLVKR